MKILAFETSCDDTAVAIVENGTEVLISKRVSQFQHQEWGGVVPEIAARLHAENWKPLLEAVLSETEINIKEIDAIAATQGPGLQTSLLTGSTAASFLSLFYQKPLIPVHHIYGHLSSIFLERSINNIPFPQIALTASGGHTELYFLKNQTQFEKIGSKIDDASGEAFDKVAKMLGLGYPGGPLVSQKAQLGNETAFDLPIPQIGKESLDFSFSGLKAAVRRTIENNFPHWFDPNENSPKSLPESFIQDLCASFQATVKKIFIKKVSKALEHFPQTQSVSFVGGVSANKYLKDALKKEVEKSGRSFWVPIHNQYSTDNAAMIGVAAYFLWLEKPDPKKFLPKMIEPKPRMEIVER